MRNMHARGRQHETTKVQLILATVNEEIIRSLSGLDFHCTRNISLFESHPMWGLSLTNEVITPPAGIPSALLKIKQHKFLGRMRKNMKH